MKKVRRNFLMMFWFCVTANSLIPFESLPDREVDCKFGEYFDWFFNSRESDVSIEDVSSDKMVLDEVLPNEGEYNEEVVCKMTKEEKVRGGKSCNLTNLTVNEPEKFKYDGESFFGSYSLERGSIVFKNTAVSERFKPKVLRVDEKGVTLATGENVVHLFSKKSNREQANSGKVRIKTLVELSEKKIIKVRHSKSLKLKFSFKDDGKQK